MTTVNQPQTKARRQPTSHAALIAAARAVLEYLDAEIADSQDPDVAQELMPLANHLRAALPPSPDASTEPGQETTPCN